MGCTTSSEEKAENARINKILAETEKEISQEIKLLLLGAGESGKSTIAKQMKIIHLNGYTEEERAGFKISIYNNVVYCMRAIVKAATDFGYPIGVEEAAARVRRPENDLLQGPITEEMAADVKALWQDKSIRMTYDRQSEFQLYDCAAYLFDNIDRIAAPDYVPTVRDVIMTRIKTTGVSELDFYVKNTHFRLVDVGGQRNERRKWMHCFQDVTAVLFVVALSEYDLKLYEDGTTNRMFESLKLFKEMCNSKWFINTAMILFLNKSDLFAEKLKHVELTCCFPDYTGGPDFARATQFITEKFVAQNDNPEKPIYPHVTCATDTKNIEVVFTAVKDLILRILVRGPQGSDHQGVQQQL